MRTSRDGSVGVENVPALIFELSVNLDAREGFVGSCHGVLPYAACACLTGLSARSTERVGSALISRPTSLAATRRSC